MCASDPIISVWLRVSSRGYTGYAHTHAHTHGVLTEFGDKIKAGEKERLCSAASTNKYAKTIVVKVVTNNETLAGINTLAHTNTKGDKRLSKANKNTLKFIVWRIYRLGLPKQYLPPPEN